MNGELLSVIENLEREKGISREILIETVEAALVSAARKVIHDKEKEIKVQLDPKTGKFVIISEGKEIESSEFGRIAAQTAKQVIIQKIREAERDIIFNEFQTKQGSIVTGTIYRIEKGLFIVDLGKTEGIIPKREQSPRDSYRQGDRIRAYILEVAKTPKGPQILLSRSHPGLVKKLFELEVLEVHEGIVEIRAVSREAGDRSKISVWSKDDKVDCVGACVGIRGSRVKNVVKELQGEKIDIVRYSDNIIEYVTAALNPAQVSSVKILDEKEKKVEVVVDDDQLSLAIGKNGQNVRLAARLTGWNIDIRSKKEKVMEKFASAKDDLSVSDLAGVGDKTVTALTQAGFDSIDKVAKASISDLTAIKGIGEKKAEKILAEAKKRMSEAGRKLEEAQIAAKFLLKEEPQTPSPLKSSPVSEPAAPPVLEEKNNEENPPSDSKKLTEEKDES